MAASFFNTLSFWSRISLGGFGGKILSSLNGITPKLFKYKYIYYQYGLCCLQLKPTTPLAPKGGI